MHTAGGSAAAALVAVAAAVAGCGGGSKTLNTAPASGPAQLRAQLFVRPLTEDVYRTATTVAVGTPVEFRLHLYNAGGSQATGVRVSNPLPRGLGFIRGSAMSRASTVSVANGDPIPDTLVTAKGANIGPRPAGASFDVVFSAKVLRRPPGGQVRDVATVHADQTAPLTAAATVTVR